MATTYQRNFMKWRYLQNWCIERIFVIHVWSNCDCNRVHLSTYCKSLIFTPVYFVFIINSYYNTFWHNFIVLQIYVHLWCKYKLICSNQDFQVSKRQQNHKVIGRIFNCRKIKLLHIYKFLFRFLTKYNSISVFSRSTIKIKNLCSVNAHVITWSHGIPPGQLRHSPFTLNDHTPSTLYWRNSWSPQSFTLARHPAGRHTPSTLTISLALNCQ